MLRTRTTTVPGGMFTESLLTGGLRCPNHPTVYTKTTGWPKTLSFSDYTSLEETIDETTRGKDSENDVWHVKTQTEMNESVPAMYAVYGSAHADNPDLPCDMITNSQPSTQFRKDYPVAGSAPFGNRGLYGISNITNPGTSITEPLVERSLIDMLPVVRAGLMSLNSIYELKDFKKMPGTVRRLKGYLRNLRAKLRNRTGKTLRELFKSTAEGYLSYEFALAPLDRDIMELWNTIISFRKQANYLLQNAGKRRVRRFTCPITDDWIVNPAPTVATKSYTYMRGGIKYTRTISFPEGDPMFRAVMDYRYDYTASQKKFLQLYALLDGLGISLNPAIIWNALPFSFVVDWVANVGSWLDDHQLRLTEPIINIYKYVWSVKAKQLIEVRAEFCPDRPVGQRSEVYMVRTTRTAYKRFAGTDLWNHCIQTSGLNLKEFSFIGAMALAR